MTKRRFTIKEDLYDAEILVFVGYRYEAMKKIVEREGAKKGITYEWDEDDIEYYNTCDGAYLHLDASNKTTIRILWLDTWEQNIEGMVLISHETEHAAYEIMQDRNVDYSNESEEAFIRYHGVLLKRCLTKLWRA